MTDRTHNSGDLPNGLPAEVLGDLQDLIADMSKDRLFTVPPVEPPPEVQADVERLVRDIGEQRRTPGTAFGSLVSSEQEAATVQNRSADDGNELGAWLVHGGELSSERPVVAIPAATSGTGPTSEAEGELVAGFLGGTDLLDNVDPRARLDAEPRQVTPWIRENWPFLLAGVFVALGLVLIVLVLTSS